MRYLLDTHTWIWWNMTPSKLTERAHAVIADHGGDELLLSAISPWEFAQLVEKGRLTISCDPETWLEVALDQPGLELVPLSPILACRSTTLPQPFHDDPADQIIVATARTLDATVLTADRRIRDYPHVRSLW